MADNSFDNFMLLYRNSFRFIKNLFLLCWILSSVFLFMAAIGAGFYYGAAKGGWKPEQEIHCENTNIFPSKCVVTEAPVPRVKK